MQRYLRQAFERCGPPLRIGADNGTLWGSPIRPGQLMGLSVWLIHLSVRLSYSHPAHPQASGKDKHLRRTLRAEALTGRYFAPCDTVQHALDAWHAVYNCECPHQAIDLATPITRYRPSPRPYPFTLAPIGYSPQGIVLNIGWNGRLRFRSWCFRFSNTLHGLPVALHPDPKHKDQFDLYFVHQHLDRIDLNLPDDR